VCRERPGLSPAALVSIRYGFSPAVRHSPAGAYPLQRIARPRERVLTNEGCESGSQGIAEDVLDEVRQAIVLAQHAVVVTALPQPLAGAGSMGTSGTLLELDNEAAQICFAGLPFDQDMRVIGHH
jgi:hypothetical protein